MPTNLVTLQKDSELPVNFSADITGRHRGGPGRRCDARHHRHGGYQEQLAQPVRSLSQTGNTDLTGIETPTSIPSSPTTRVLVNGLLGVALDFGRNKVRWTNLYIHDTLKTARLGIGTDFTLGIQGFDFANQNTAFYERQLIDSQLVGRIQIR